MPLPQLDGANLAQHLSTALPGATAPAPTGAAPDRAAALWVQPQHIANAAAILMHDEQLDFQYLNAISAIDYIGHFELVYHLTSFRRGHKATMRARLDGRDNLSAPSVYHLWRGADFQEREIWDLMGIRFDGHPNMKRIMLWEGFEGHPLRKDFL